MTELDIAGMLKMAPHRARQLEPQVAGLANGVKRSCEDGLFPLDLAS